MKKLIIILLISPLIIYILLLLNSFAGNPISKAYAEKKCIQYYESKYHMNFVVHSCYYQFNIPCYRIEIGPENNKNIKFEATMRVDQLWGIVSSTPDYTDAYGGAVASQYLTDAVSSILKPGCGYLNFQITTEEIRTIVYDEQHPNYYDNDTVKRIENNIYRMKIVWTDNGYDGTKIKTIALEMKKLIESQSPYKPENITFLINVKSAKEDNKILFKGFMNLFSQSETATYIPDSEGYIFIK